MSDTNTTNHSETALGDPDKSRSTTTGDATSSGIIPPDSWSHAASDDLDPFYINDGGTETLVGPGDLKATVPNANSESMVEIDRYWLDKPYSFCVIYHAKEENEYLYYVIEPYLTPFERRLKSFFDKQLRSNIDYDNISLSPTEQEQQEIIRDTFYELLRRYSLVRRGELSGNASNISKALDWAAGVMKSHTDRRRESREDIVSPPRPSEFDDDDFRGAPEDAYPLNQRQVAKLTYYLIRDSVGRDKIEPLKHDRMIEDTNCDAPGVEIFIDHSNHEQLITNIVFGDKELDRFIEKLANRAGKGISRRQPNVDATLPDGSRAQLTLGTETTTHGSNFTIRQFRDVPFTPVDLISWETFNLDQLAYLWLCIESGKSVIFAGGTSSGKTTSLNALSLFIPGTHAKVVSIEDTPELNLPQKNWIQQTTRDPFVEDGSDAIAELDLLQVALRQNPDYIIMGEVRGKEGSVMFQGMSSGHTCFTTFHANSPDQVIKRFVSDDIGVSREFFNELDIIVNQQLVRVDGEKARRATQITELGAYDKSSDQVEKTKIFDLDAYTDEFVQTAPSGLLAEIRQNRGWSTARLEWELLKRQAVLAYLVENDITSYRGVASAIQAVLSEEVSILEHIADRELATHLDELAKMRSVQFDVDEEAEESVPRPDIPERVVETASEVLADAMPFLQKMKENVEDPAEASEKQEAAARFIPEVAEAGLNQSLRGSRSVDIEWGTRSTSSEPESNLEDVVESVQDSDEKREAGPDTERRSAPTSSPPTRVPGQDDDGTRGASASASSEGTKVGDVDTEAGNGKEETTPSEKFEVNHSDESGNGETPSPPEQESDQVDETASDDRPTEAETDADDLNELFEDGETDADESDAGEDAESSASSTGEVAEDGTETPPPAVEDSVDDSTEHSPDDEDAHGTEDGGETPTEDDEEDDMGGLIGVGPRKSSGPAKIDDVFGDDDDDTDSSEPSEPDEEQADAQVDEPVQPADDSEDTTKETEPDVESDPEADDEEAKDEDEEFSEDDPQDMEDLVSGVLGEQPLEDE